MNSYRLLGSLLLGLSASLQAADTIITWGMFHTPPSIDLSDLVIILRGAPRWPAQKYCQNQ